MDVNPLSMADPGLADRGEARPRRTQAERRAEAEANLLAAAARLIAECGLERVSLAQIGLEAGYSRGLVNHHFGSKARLIERLVEYVQVDFIAVAERSSSDTLSGTPLDRVLALARTFLGMLDDLSPIHRAFLVLWAGAVVAPREVREAMAQSDRVFRSAVAAVVEEGIREGSLRASVTAYGFATILVGQLRGVSLQVLIDADGVDLEETKTEMERSISCWLTSDD